MFLQMARHRISGCQKDHLQWIAVALLLSIQAGLITYSATWHSPTLNEPGHLVAGLSHWEFGRFEVYRVNPPLVHYVAAIPVLIAGYEADWSGFHDTHGARPEFNIGEDFIRANGKRSLWLFTIARWACLPFAIIGGLFCFAWSRELWRSNLAGLISLTLWCFEPNILAHGELITPDCAAMSFGLGTTYLFWRWLRQPTWGRAAAAGLVLGLAELTKTSWIILFGLWPMLWLLVRWTEARRQRSEAGSRKPEVGDQTSSAGAAATSSTLNAQPSTPINKPHQIFPQLVLILALALYVLNLGYGFDGTFTKLRDFMFVSHALTGLKPGDPGNRFAGTWLGALPVPVPKQYLRGIDLQKKDFENYGQLSYLRGEWKDGGWWYYYIYGLAVKTPHGSQAMLLIALFTLAFGCWSRPKQSRSGRHQPPESQTPLTIDDRPSSTDLIVLLTPPVVLVVLVSSQLEFNHHVRYVLPVLGFAFVMSGVTARWFERRGS